MKKIIFLFLFTNLLLAQNEPQLQWVNVQPNSEIGGTVSVVSSTKDLSGNLYLIGSFNNTVDFDSSPNTNKLTSFSESDLFISKYNSDGDFIWAKNIGGLGTITPRNIEFNGTSLYITGSFTGLIDFDSSSSTANQISNGGSDFFIVKYDLDGNYSIAISIGGTGSDDALDAKIFNNEIIIVGSFIDTVDFDPSPSLFELVSSGLFTDIFISKYSTNLEFLSAFKIGGTSSDSASSFVVDSTGDLIITGLFRETVDFDISTNTANLTSTSTDASNAFVLKYSNDENFIWVKDIGARSSLNAVNKITLDTSNDILICGAFNLASDFNPSTSIFTLTPSSTFNNDAFAAKYDALGNFVWAKRLGSVQGNDKCYSIITDNINNVYIAGENGFSSQSNGFIIKYNTLGTVSYTFNIGTKASKILLNDTLDSLYVFGNFINNYDFNPSPSVTNFLYAEINNGFIAKYTLDGNYTFSKNIGGISSNNNFNLVSTDGNGNVYRAGNLGSSLDLDPSSTIVNTSSTGWTDFYIAKYTTNGEYVWSKTIEGLNFNGVNIMNTDTNGNTYVIGRFFGTVDFDPSSNIANLTSSSTTITRDSYIAKYDTDGNFLWAKKIDNVNPIDSIQFDNEGNFYFMGRYSGTVDFDPSSASYFLTAAFPNSADMFFTKFSPLGELIWAKSLRTTIDGTLSIPYRLYIRSSNIYLTGILSGSIDFDPSITQTNVLMSNSSPIGFLAKYDLEGNHNFAFKFEDSSSIGYNVWGSNVVVDSNNDIYFITLFGGEVDFDPSETSSTYLTSTNGLTLGISKHTSNGSLLWAKSLQNLDGGGSGISNEDIQVFIDSNNNIIICSEIIGSFDFDPSPNQTIISSPLNTTGPLIRNLFFAKYNSEGELITANKLEGNYDARLTSAIYTTNQDLLISGSYTGTIDFDLTVNSQAISSSSSYYNDRFFAKYFNSTLSTPEYNNQNSFIVYPNPTSSTIKIYSPFLNNVKVKVTDLTGKILYVGIMNNDIELNVANYSIGLYAINIEDKENNKTETYKFLKK